MNPVKRVMPWLRGSTDAGAVADAQRLRGDSDTIRISQNTPTTFGSPNPLLAPTPDVVDPGSEDGHKHG